MTTTSRYCVGIDLGTTNTAVSFVDVLTAEADSQASVVFEIAQRVSADGTQRRRTLPSTVLLNEPEESRSVGTYALEQQAYTPDKVVSSSKSWMCHGGVNREARILPWGFGAQGTSDLLSPLDAARSILEAVKSAWNVSMASHEASFALEYQNVIITVPASFDEVAQQLTVRAAQEAGFTKVRLIEEPQAAFYRWIESQGNGPGTTLLQSSISVLVCDVGGGTTDLSLFTVDTPVGAELPRITRQAVSEHILLGGDNIDASVAEQLRLQFVEKTGQTPSYMQQVILRRLARGLKEQALSESVEEGGSLSVALAGTGSALFGNSVTLTLARELIRELILEGFFPRCSVNEQLQGAKSGLREMGLPYARDPRITAQVSAFLAGRGVDAVLFNGGSLANSEIRARVLACISSWQPGRPIQELKNDEMDLAVARGAAWYGYMLIHNQRRIILAGYPRSLYLELFRQRKNDTASLLCIIEKGFSSTESVSVVASGLAAVVNRPVRFQVWSALERDADKIGDVVSLNDGEFYSLAPIAAKLDAAQLGVFGTEGRIPIQLRVRLSETGLCEIECVPLVEEPQAGVPTTWRFEFGVRHQEKEREAERDDDEDSKVPPAVIQRCIEAIDAHFGKRRDEASTGSPKALLKDIEKLVGLDRKEWPLYFMRSLWAPLFRGISRRSRSLEHELAWLALAGFILRPGFGTPLDVVRMKEAWKLFDLGLAFPKHQAAKIAWAIFWRRVSGGLDPEQQSALYAQGSEGSDKGLPHDIEIVRMISSLERIGPAQKEKILADLIAALLNQGAKQSNSLLMWAIERVGARVPLYAELDTVVVGGHIEATLSQLIRLQVDEGERVSFSRMLVSLSRRTNDPRRDISSEQRSLILKKLAGLGAAEELLQSVESVVGLDVVQHSRLFGDDLPAGIELASQT
jgi:molecular chaperone DnaK (HSP70)